jgi:hypothetical protein
MIDDLISKYNLSFTVSNSLKKKLSEIEFIDHGNEYKLDIRKNFKVNSKFKDRKNYFNYLYIYTYKKRTIEIFSKNKHPKNLINEIDKIINFFDSIVKYNLRIHIQFYMFRDQKKGLPVRANITSGSTVLDPGKILIFKVSEWRKVLIHEAIHYYNMHIYTLNKDLLYIYQSIITDSKLSPNEGYTEFFALILYYHLYHPLQIKEHLTKELAFGFLQTAKILKLKNFNNYEELICAEKEYSQDCFVLSYFLLKTYFLYKTRYQNCIKMGWDNDNVKCFEDINLNEKKFASIINYCMQEYNPVKDRVKSINFSLT